MAIFDLLDIAQDINHTQNNLNILLDDLVLLHQYYCISCPPTKQFHPYILDALHNCIPCINIEETWRDEAILVSLTLVQHSVSSFPSFLWTTSHVSEINSSQGVIKIYLLTYCVMPRTRGQWQKCHFKNNFIY